MFPLAVALSAVALLVGPLLVGAARPHPSATALLDAATLGILPAVVLVRLLPHVALESGAWAVAAFAAGFALCVVVESRAHGDGARLAEAMVLPPLALHAFLDGAALALAFKTAEAGVAQATLGGALVFHKLPEGLFVGTTYVHTRGIRTALVRSAFLAGATVVGALAGRELMAHAPNGVLHIALAFGLGAMLRIVTHSHARDDLSPALAALSGCVFLAGVAVVVTLPSQRILFAAQPHELPVAGALVPLFLETAPWVALAIVADAVASRARSWARGIDALAIAAMVPLLGLRAAALVALAQIAIAWSARDGDPPSGESARRSYALGVLVCVGGEAALPSAALASSPVLAALASLVVLLPWLRGAGAVLCAAVLVHKGASTSLVLPTLLASFAVPYVRLPKVVFGVGLLVGIAVALPLAAPPLHAVGDHAHALYEWIAAACVAALVVADVLRSGPRRWFALA